MTKIRKKDKLMRKMSSSSKHKRKKKKKKTFFVCLFSYLWSNAEQRIDRRRFEAKVRGQGLSHFVCGRKIETRKQDAKTPQLCDESLAFLVSRLGRRTENEGKNFCSIRQTIDASLHLLFGFWYKCRNVIFWFDFDLIFILILIWLLRNSSNWFYDSPKLSTFKRTNWNIQI